MASLEERLKQQARTLGFDLAGIAPAVEADSFDRLRAWLERGYAGEMSYLHRQAEPRRHPASILPTVRSVVMVAMNYHAECGAPNTQRKKEAPDATAKIARYAQGSVDYHEVLWERLGKLLGWVQEQAPGCQGRAVVDTAPLLERDFARRAGLGWIGKNTLLLNKHLGSYFFLGALARREVLNPEGRSDSP